jgi:sorbitol/mannitol transport system substrate-binding protein
MMIKPTPIVIALHALSALFLYASSASATELVIATVNNRQMIEMQKHTAVFEKQNKDISLKWITLEESDLRQKVSADVTNKVGTYDVVTIGMYETPIWAAKGWLKEILPSDAYNVKDLIPTVKDGLSYKNKLFAAPFYGEGSMTMYRADLFAKAGITINNRPTWKEIASAAQKLHKPSAGQYGICLRGKAGWGDNMALVSTMVNTFGGQWFDMKWQPQIDSKPWKEAVTFYTDLLTKYGPPNPQNYSFNENLSLFANGKCAIMVDATSLGAALIDPKLSKVANDVAFALAPTSSTTKGAGWLWSWALAIPASSKHADAAQRFVQWATSEQYLDLVQTSSGWASLPSGTRLSTYRRPEFKKEARFAVLEAIAMVTANPQDATEPRSPYTGIQFAAIPEFPEIGNITGQEIKNSLENKTSIALGLQKANAAAQQIMRTAGYFK